MWVGVLIYKLKSMFCFYYSIEVVATVKLSYSWSNTGRPEYNLCAGDLISPGQQESCEVAIVGGVLGGFTALVLVIVVALAITLGVK